MILAPALCLDLDGTCRITVSGEAFAKHDEDYQLNKNIEQIIWSYRDKGYTILGFTNQGGVAHGFKTQQQADKELEFFQALFERNPFHYIYSAFCDSKGTVEPYNHRSLLRKPAYGMLALAEVDLFKQGYITDWDNSLFVGDRPEDEETAASAGIEFCHINQFFSNHN